MSAPESGPVLARAMGVSKTFHDGPTATTVLREIGLELRPGELTLLMGPSGSGKTTLISILAGLLRPTAGQVELCGVPISELGDAAAAAVRRSSVGFVFQGCNLFPALTALDNVAEILVLKGMALAGARACAREALTSVGLGHRVGHRPGNLSGGEKQRVAIARALAGEPGLVIGDEPTAAIDTATGVQLMEIIRAQVRPGRGVLIVTHDHRLERFADRIVEMEDGRIRGERSLGGTGPGPLPGVASGAPQRQEVSS